jgi:prepilin-type processing-associated H-X9-DG protein
MNRGHKSVSIADVLAAVAVVAILAMILFPVFGQSRGLTQQATCLANTHEIGLATLMYAQDYDETMPPAMQTGGAQVADLCGFAGGQVIQTLYDTLYPYLGNSQVLQCPTAPEAVDLCTDIALVADELGSEYGGIDLGSLNIVGNVRYVSYAFNYYLFGVGGVELGGIDVTSFFHDEGLPWPTAIAAIVYPADTPTVYDGYFVGEAPVTVAIPRHSQTANVAYVDGHSAPFSMAQQANYVTDMYTGLPVNQYYIATGPYRANPGAEPNSAFNGIVTDPICTTEALPQTECIEKSAAPVGTPTFVSNVAASPGSGTAVVTWVTSVPASGVVLYGTTVQLGSSTGTVGMTTSQSVTLTGLKARTLYHYRVQSTNASGNVVVSGDQTFTTTFLAPIPIQPRQPVGPGGVIVHPVPGT